MREVHVHAVGVVGHVRAARATLLPSWAEHEVLHQQLAAAFEQLGEGAPPFGCIEDVLLVDALPRQRAALAGDLVAQMRQLPFARQQLLALGNPSVAGHDGMVHGIRVGMGYVHGLLLVRDVHDLTAFGRRTARTFMRTRGPTRPTSGTDRTP